MESQRILIIEDEVKIARFLQLELEHEGYIVTQCHDGREGLSVAEQGSFDLLILDIMLPSMNGIEVLRRLRQSSEMPVIMLTAKDEIMDKVFGLDMGANDYVTKPFAIEELLARIRAALKRRTAVPTSSPTPAANVVEHGGVKLDLDKYMVTCQNENVELTKREFDLLQYLMQNKNIVLTRDRMLQAVWGYDYAGDTNVVDVYIRYLRSKLDDRYGIKLIHTVRGVGYLIKDES